MSKVKTLNIDLECYSDNDLKKCGVYKYTESPNFEILLFGVSVNDSDVHVYDLASGETVPDYIIDAITDDSVVKWAYNAAFERICISKWLRANYPEKFTSYSISDDTVERYLSPASWRCSMIWGAYLGLPLSLEETGKVLNLNEQKMTEGKALIKYFCVPCKPTNTNGMRTRNLPTDDPVRWSTFKAYNKRDVGTEMAIQKRLSKIPVPEFLWDEYHLDQEINDRGIGVDMDLVEKAIEIDAISREELNAKMKELTSLENPNSVMQMKDWLNSKGLEIESLAKKDVSELIKVSPAELKEVLELRQKLSKSSVKKYQAMLNAHCDDGRLRGMFQFYGANRSGRWAGRIVQLQNLPRNQMPDLEIARELVRNGDYEKLKCTYDSVPNVLSELIRTAFIPRDGYKFIVADFSSIEARVLSFLAKENWRLQVFDDNKDIYCMSASAMFGVPVEKHGVNAELRQKGKIAELACIAEDELVLTDKGLMPIQDVTLQHRLWDGEEWIKHDGVIFKGEGEIIEYEGLRATKDHPVFIKGQSEPIPFGLASSRRIHLVKTGDSSLNRKSTSNRARVYDIVNAGPHHRFTVSNCLVHNCGYGGSVGALKAMGALDMGLKEEELQPLVEAWRASNPNIVEFWWDVDRAVKSTVRLHLDTETHGLRFMYRNGYLMIRLPSGRCLCYAKPVIETNEYGGESVSYFGVGPTKKWEHIQSYGPKFVENIVQAISRDLLMNAMKTLSYCFICGHVHDELIIECSRDVSVEALCEQMSRTPPWMKGLNLRAEGYETSFYKKE